MATAEQIRYAVSGLLDELSTEKMKLKVQLSHSQHQIRSDQKIFNEKLANRNYNIKHRR